MFLHVYFARIANSEFVLKWLFGRLSLFLTRDKSRWLLR